eukprot:TRINITY_DN139_c0_g1_i1.p1 TRINITY_DN139_c0_g1~~TRINITY_DN139_c0_g1_i1.p1  ORF type:complete len:321 (+),score=162.58 TRINITY_DN139_c0_g1_i1:67-1029(+)
MKIENGMGVMGPYMFGQRIGQGSFGLVRLGVDTRTQKKIAAKIFTKAKLTEDARAEIDREIQIMETLSHDNILKLLDVVEDEQDLVLILELAGRGQLEVPKLGFTEDTARDCFKQLVMSLQHCHNRGVAHLDIKPGNILLSKDRQLKLADFGLSGYQERGDKPFIKHGSPRFAAPEVFRGDAKDGYKVDVWAVGVTLFHLLTGEYPFDLPRDASGSVRWEGKESLKTIRNQVISGEYLMPRHIPKAAQDLISRCLTKDITQRISLSEILLHPWVVNESNLSKASGLMKKMATVLTPKALKSKRESRDAEALQQRDRAHSR